MLNRIMKEYGEITATPPAGCTIKLPQEGDMNLWDVTLGKIGARLIH